MPPPSGLVEKLSAEGTPFAHVTVVRAQAPAPARPGDDAVVLADGTVLGFVGGQCVESSVRTAALDALADGHPILVRVLPGGTQDFPEMPGARVVVNPCLSGGALEIFVEPRLPAPVVAVTGDTPIAAAVARLAESLGFVADVRPSLAGDPPHGARAAVVATHGHDEPESVRAALDAGVAYVGLVASRHRGRAVLDSMGLDGGERARVRTPAGIDIGARTPAEVGLSIMAEIVQTLRTAPDVPGAPREAGAAGGAAGTAEGPVHAVDPVCGMTVTVSAQTPHRLVGGRETWFCSTGCAESYLA